MDGKTSRSTRWSLAACLATVFDWQFTDTSSNLLRNCLRSLIRSLGDFGDKSTLVIKSSPWLMQAFLKSLVRSCLLLLGRGTPTDLYPSSDATCSMSSVSSCLPRGRCRWRSMRFFMVSTQYLCRFQ